MNHDEDERGEALTPEETIRIWERAADLAVINVEAAADERVDLLADHGFDEGSDEALGAVFGYVLARLADQLPEDEDRLSWCLSVVMRATHWAISKGNANPDGPI